MDVLLKIAHLLIINMNFKIDVMKNVRLIQSKEKIMKN